MISTAEFNRAKEFYPTLIKKFVYQDKVQAVVVELTGKYRKNSIFRLFIDLTNIHTAEIPPVYLLNQPRHVQHKSFTEYDEWLGSLGGRYHKVCWGRNINLWKDYNPKNRSLLNLLSHLSNIL